MSWNGSCTRIPHVNHPHEVNKRAVMNSQPKAAAKAAPEGQEHGIHLEAGIV